MEHDNIFGKLIDTKLPYLLSVYIEEYKKYKHLILGDDVLSGWICCLFLISLPCTLSKSQREKIDYEGKYEKILAYVFLYLIIDNYVDSVDVGYDDKIKLIKWLKNRDYFDGMNEFYTTIYSLYALLVNTSAKEEEVDALIKAISLSWEIERNEHRIDIYLQSCKMKGGLTVSTAASLIYDEVVFNRDELIQLGYCIQLADDMVDISSDLRDGITTPFTYYVKLNQRSDCMIRLLRNNIRLLPSKYELYKDILIISILSNCNKSKHVSCRLKRLYYIEKADVRLKKLLQEKMFALINT